MTNTRLNKLKRAYRARFQDKRDNGPCRMTPDSVRRIVGIRITGVLNFSQWYMVPRYHIGFGVNFCHWFCVRLWWDWEYRCIPNETRK